ncbi:MAG: hypothetical protein ACKOFO_02200 [Gemmatimonadota bacterium]
MALSHDGKAHWTLPASGDLRARVAPLWGRDVADRFVTVEDVTGTVRVSGIVERPSDVGTAARRVVLTVNGRAIRDPGLVRAAEAAYRTTIPSGVRPSLLLEVELPGRELDVNVHPAKAEVRFADRWTVERAVERAVRRALGTEDAAAVMGAFAPAPATALPLRTITEPDALRSPSPMAPAPLFDALPPSEAVPVPAARPEDEFVVPPLVQLHRTYLAFEREDALVLIDQHSAHERVLYERFLHGFEGGATTAQRLLFPLTLHLSAAEAEAFEVHRALFARLGYEGEGFGGTSLLVHVVRGRATILQVPWDEVDRRFGRR